MRGIRKCFGRTVALDDAVLEVRTGTLHALLGENGAGKTTLMRIAFGMLAADEGSVAIAGVERPLRSSIDALAVGVGMVHQHFLLVPAMTVAENVSLGDSGFFGGYSPEQAARRVRRIGEATGLILDPAVRVEDLPVAAQQRLEIVKALAREVKLLILDEPTAVLTPSESQELYSWLQGFVARGNSVVLITHKVREALAVADAVTVLRRGRTVLNARVTVETESQVLQALLGESTGPAGAAPGRTPAPGRLLVQLISGTVNDARGVARLREASLEVRTGEILGIAGVEGSGQQELVRVLAGRIRLTSGVIRLPSRIGFVPEDRLRDAVIPGMTLTENFALKEAGSTRGIMPWEQYRARTLAMLRAFDVQASSAEAHTATLSGGNQQRFVLGRELEGPPELLVVENPTRGLDIRATEQVLERLRVARNSGAAVVVYSSDLDELLSIADRLVVCFGGKVSSVATQADAVARALVGLS